MEIDFKINQRGGDDVGVLVWDVFITKGKERIETESELIEAMKTTVPAKKGIIQTHQINDEYWVVYSQK